VSDWPWYSPEIAPPINRGSERWLMVAVRRGHSGKVYSFPALYLSEYTLSFDDEETDERSVTGWYSAEGNSDGDGLSYSALLERGDELVAWGPTPIYPGSETKPIPILGEPSK